MTAAVVLLPGNMGDARLCREEDQLCPPDWHRQWLIDNERKLQL
jgi:hypothetical protein